MKNQTVRTRKRGALNPSCGCQVAHFLSFVIVIRRAHESSELAGNDIGPTAICTSPSPMLCPNVSRPYFAF